MLLFKVLLTLVCAVLIASVGLLMRAAEDRERSFDATEATLYTESIKLILAIGWTLTSRPRLTHDQYTIISSKPIAWLYFCPASIGFCIVNNLRFELVRLVNPGLLQVLWNLKVVVIGLLYALPPFRRPLVARQWLGAFLLVLGTSSAEISQSNLMREDEAASHQATGFSSLGEATGGSTGIALIAFLLFLTSCSAIATEYAYKNTDLPLCIQNIIMYQLGVLLNFFARSIKCFFAFSTCSSHLGQGFSVWTWCVVLMQALSGYTVGAIIKYIDCVAQVAADVIAIVFSSWISFVFFDLRFSLGYITALLLSLMALAIYYLPFSFFSSKIVNYNHSSRRPSVNETKVKHHDSSASLLHDTDDREGVDDSSQSSI